MMQRIASDRLSGPIQGMVPTGWRSFRINSFLRFPV